MLSFDPHTRPLASTYSLLSCYLHEGFPPSRLGKALPQHGVFLLVASANRRIFAPEIRNKTRVITLKKQNDDEKDDDDDGHDADDSRVDQW